MTMMCVLQKAVRCVHAASPWWSENTMCAVYSVGHDLPCPPNAAAAKFVHWLTSNAVWSKNRSTDREIPTYFQPEGYTPTWCEDIALLRNIVAMP